MWLEYTLGIISAFIVLAMFYFGYKILRNKIIEDKMKEIILSLNQDAKITNHSRNHLYQMEYDGDKSYLFKIIDMNPRYEVIITNSDRVVINDDIRNWKRSTKPHFIPGVREFIKLHSEQEAVKIIVIYPNCHNITKYINETDAYKVEKNQKVDGLHFVRFTDLKDFLANH